MPNNLIVMSVDAMFDEDRAYAKTLPNFGRLLENAAWVEGGMRTIYPSLTYPAHVSLITGTYPERHGVFHNELPTFGQGEPDWHWYRQDIQTDTLMDVAHRAGLTTACLGWPTMGADPASDWLIPEIWPKRGQDNLMEVLGRSASANVLSADGVLTRHLHAYRKLGRIFVDQAIVGCACDLIARHQPDVMCLHVAYLDYVRHGNGLFGTAVEQALIAHDDWLGRIMQACMDAGTYAHTNFAIISDHGQLMGDRVLNPNVLLAEAGLITLDEAGSIVDWKAYCDSAGLSCQVIVREPDNAKDMQALRGVLHRLLHTPEYGVEAVFTKEEALREHHLRGDFHFVLEGAQGTAFGYAHTGDVLMCPDNGNYKYARATHGHLPHKGAQPIFFMSGPDIRAGAYIERQHVIDEAPTFARLLGQDMPTAQGKPLDALLCVETKQKSEM